MQNKPKIMQSIRKLSKLKKAKTARFSSWDTTGKNQDNWSFQPGESRVLADIKGPGAITHIWMTQYVHYRKVLLKITWDNADHPSVCVPLGDFFCLGHGYVNSFQSLLFTASTRSNNTSVGGCALNCYVYMPFKERALVELVNESKEPHLQYFYIDHEIYDDASEIEGMGYFHAEFHRENPFGGWGHEIPVNRPEANIQNKEKLAWDNNYVILETKGKGHYIGCNISISNFQGSWWGEGDDMIWVDGYKWPPDLHGTGSEDYLNQAWGMQDNAFLRNGSSLHEENTKGYQTSYVFHLENPVRFEKEVKVTIEHGHGNHLRNEVSSVAYWYAEKPTRIKDPPPVEKRLPVKKVKDEWVHDPDSQITTREIEPNEEMRGMKSRWRNKDFPEYVDVSGEASIDEDGLLCLNIHLSRDNPELYEVPLVELLEFFVDKEVNVEIKTSGEDVKYSGKLLEAADGELAVSKIHLGSYLKGLPGKKLQLEAILDYDGWDDDEKQPDVYKIRITEL
ncbi:MAG: glycoside hydrolase family 172 protein [Candidatus Hodarchaeota archaeon]